MEPSKVDPPPPAPVNPPQTGGQQVTCFVSKQIVPRSAARQLRHPKAGLVWVSEQYIK